jgi:hypothetical protein
VISASARRALLVCLAFAAIPGRASAEQPADRPVVEALRVEADACLDREALAAHVVAWIHRDRIDRRIEIAVRGGPGSPEGVGLTVLRDGAVVGERRFEIAHVPCEEGRAAIGLAIALAIDNTLLGSLGPSDPPAPPNESPAPAPPSSPVPAPPPPAPPSPSPIGLGMSLDLVGVAVLLPTVVGGVAPAFELIPHRRFEIRLSGLLTFPESTFALGGGRVGAAIYAGRLDACAAFHLGARIEAERLSTIRLHACAGVLAGALHSGVVSGLDPSPSPTAPWASAALRFDARVAITRRLGLALSVDALVPLVRPEIDATTVAGTVVDAHPLAPAGVAVGLGPHVLFQ